MITRRLVPVDGGRLEVESTGRGEPVVVIQTALDDGELRPFAAALTEHGGIEVVHVLRRGYGGSTAPLPQPSIATDAADIVAVVRALDLAPVHVVGVSYSAAVALTLAVSDPDVVRSLTVVEPPPSGAAGAADFRDTCEQLRLVHAARGPLAALEDFMTMLMGADWREVSERDRPGSVAAVERGAPTFLGADLPSLVAWTTEAPDLSRIRCPVLHVGGSATGPWFTRMRDHLLEVVPHATSATVDGAGHLLASSHPAELSALVAARL